VLVAALNLSAKVEELPLALTTLVKEFHALRKESEEAEGRNAPEVLERYNYEQV